MPIGSVREKNRYPLTYGVDTSAWVEIKSDIHSAFKALSKEPVENYESSKKAIREYFMRAPIQLKRPVAVDDDARAVLDMVFEVEEELIEEKGEREELYRRIGRHIREYLADDLLQKHLSYLEEIIQRGDEGAQEYSEKVGLADRFTSSKSLRRFLKKVEIYKNVRSFVHPAELTLSTIKVKNRSRARAVRGNLWTIDRREKYEYLEQLSDEQKIFPPFTEADLEFLVSQSSLEMLQKKASLLLKEIGYIEPNRLKANHSRLKDHLDRNHQRKSDYERRRELLIKLGASEEQIDYISARATYQTMQNLLKLAKGKIAISDLMGGKRTIKKLLRRQGQAKSSAEEAIALYLQREEGISRRVAESYARTRKNHSIEHLKQTLEFLKENYRRFYRNHWGFSVQEKVLRRAMEYGLSRQKLSKRALSSRDFLQDLRKALAKEESQFIKEQSHLDMDERRAALAPLKEVLEYETDTDTKKQLYFIYEQFCRYGLCIPKDKLKEICLQHPTLFPSPRKVQDALEILNGAYRCIGQHGESLCVLPDYLELPKKNELNFYP